MTIEDLQIMHEADMDQIHDLDQQINSLHRDAEQQRDEIDRLQRRVNILEQAINWTILEMADCRPGSVGDVWKKRLADARKRSRAVEAGRL